MTCLVEEWRPVVGFEGAYEVSSLGQVRSLDRIIQVENRWGGVNERRLKGRILLPGAHPSGHLMVSLGARNHRFIHALVLRAFVGPAPKGHEARHRNGAEKDNSLSNLKWDTRANNARDKKWHKGARNYKLTPAEVTEIKRSLNQSYWGIQGDLAEEYGVSRRHISSIKTGRCHIDVRP